MSSERDYLIVEIAQAIRDEARGRAGFDEYDDELMRNDTLYEFYEAIADAALKVIERSDAASVIYDRICTCGQSGYPENSPFSNHPHASDCPQSN